MVLQLGRFAIPLSKATICGAALANFAIQSRRRHPLADRPVIAYNVAVVFEPMTLAGLRGGNTAPHYQLPTAVGRGGECRLGMSAPRRHTAGNPVDAECHPLNGAATY